MSAELLVLGALLSGFAYPEVLSALALLASAALAGDALETMLLFLTALVVWAGIEDVPKENARYSKSLFYGLILLFVYSLLNIESGGVLFTLLSILFGTGMVLYSKEATGAAKKYLAFMAVAVLLILGGGMWAQLGFLMELGLAPFHFWLPAVYSVSGSALTALFSGLKPSMVAGHLEPSVLVSAVAAVSVVVGAVLMICQKSLRRVLAYSSIHEFAFIAMAMGLGNLGLMKILVLAHFINKAALFISTKAVIRQLGTDEIGKLGGIADHMPIAAGAFGIAALSVSGVPPLVGYYGKLLLYKEMIGGGGLYLALLFLAAEFVALAGMVRTWFNAFMAESRRRGMAGETFNEKSVLLILVVLMVLGGLYAGLLSGIIIGGGA